MGGSQTLFESVKSLNSLPSKPCHSLGETIETNNQPKETKPKCKVDGQKEENVGM